MNSSGIKRGLATTAISALAVVGLPTLAGTASATPLGAELGDSSVTLYSQYSGKASTKSDGVNTTVHLLAGGGKDVKQVRFEYQLAGGSAQQIATVDTRSNGAFSHNWQVPGNILGATVMINVVGLDANGVALAGPAATKTVVVGAGSEAVDIAAAPGSRLGVFEEPYSLDKHLYGAVSGTTSGTSPQVRLVGGSAPAAAAELTGTDKATGISTFSGIADFKGYPFATATPTTPAVDQAVIGVEDGSDDVESVTLYQQKISQVGVVASPSNVPNGAQSDATVTVLDQDGKAIAGARVVQTGGAAKMTDSQGHATFSVPEGTSTFHVDTTDEAGYQEGTDFRRSITVTGYAPELKSLATASHDGAAFDKDEYADGDIAVSAKDQFGTDMSPGDLQGTWTITPFAADAKPVTVKAAIAGNGHVSMPTGQPDGTYVLNVWKEKDGTPGESSGDLTAAPLTVKAGQAAVVWDAPKNLVQVQAGTSTTQGGVLRLADGTTLAGRTLDIAFAVKGDAKMGATQPAGTTRVSDTVARVVTAADGGFEVTLTDPAVVAPAEQTSELDDRLDASSAPLGITANDTPDLVVDFVDVKVATIEVTDGSALIDGKATPGRPVTHTITLKNAKGEPLKGASVELSLDHGFFTPTAVDAGDLKPAAAPAVGSAYGAWMNEGATKTVTTDANGQAVVTVAIEKDAGFDDDGRVDATLTATAGGKSGQKVQAFHSEDALNPGPVTVEFSQDQESRVLPKAQTETSVSLDVFAKDQFGNLTSALVDVSDNTDVAYVTDRWWDDVDSVMSQFTEDSPALRADSERPVSQVITGLWDDADTNTYVDGDSVTPGVQAERKTGSVDVSDDAPAIAWYDIDYAASSYSIKDNGTALNPVGKTVIVTYTALDQEGNPIEGLEVQFFRSGPDDLQDGNGQRYYETDENGVARYVFQGAKAGEAVVTAIAHRQNNAIDASEQSVTIAFGTAPTPPAAISARLTGADNGKKADVLTVKAGKANGAVVRLYKVVNGARKRVATSKLNSLGAKSFTVKDSNGTKRTRYVAVVSATSDTKADTSSTKTVR